METLENGKNVMKDSVDRTSLEVAMMEKDPNANEPTTPSNQMNNVIAVPDRNEDLVLETEINKPAGVAGDESGLKVPGELEEKEKKAETETESRIEPIEVKEDDKKLNVDEAVPSKSTDKEVKDSQARASPQSTDKDVKINGAEIKGESVVKEGRRKRRMSNVQGRDSSTENKERVNKRKRSKSDSDKFCWRCHKESIDSQCTACPRAWHRRCMGGGPQASPQNWICGECATILKAENAETRSTAMAQLSVEQLCTLLRHVVGRMRDYPGSEPFWKAVDLNEVPNYLDYVVKPMDLTLLECNVRAKLYGSTEAFMADAKWIQHNCIVFNTCGGVYTDTSKLTNAARQIIKAARQEVSEIEACPDCYGHARNLPRPQPSWFIEPCRRPHPLVWAKLKGFPFWPAKVMSRVNGQGHVDVRFFGAHDRAWVPTRDLYLYSKDPPAPLPRKRKSDMDECVREIMRHAKKLEMVFGEFKFAPPKIQYNPRDPFQIQLMLPNYDPLQSNNSSISLNATARKKPLNANQFPVRKRAALNSKKASTRESMISNNSDSANESRGESGSDCETYTEGSKIPKVASLESRKKNTKTKSLSFNKSSNVKNVVNNPSDNENFQGDKKNDTKRKSSIAVNNPENSSNDNINTDDEIQTEQKNRSLNKSSDGQSSSENEIPLNIRQSLKGNSTLHKAKEVTVEPSTRHNDTGYVQDPKIKMKNSQKASRHQVRVYKPKTRMVNQVNAERAKATATIRKKELIKSVNNVNYQKRQREISDSDTSLISAVNEPNSSPTVPTNADKIITASNGHSNHAITVPANSSSTVSIVGNAKMVTEPQMTSILLINNSPESPGKRVKLMKNCFGFSELIPIVKQEPKDHPQHHTSKKESKARKSFVNKPPVFPQIPTPLSPPKAPASPPDAMVYIPGQRTENESDYLLLPPEAGPLSAQLHRGGQELAKRMAQLMEEALAEASQIHSNHQDNAEINPRATVHHLRLQIERMRWQHQQHLAELKHNTDLTLREMRASLEAERHRAVEETKREAEEERFRSVEETKRKQWCAFCGNEALFYCCWNTAYCDYPCQQTHWSTHMRTCAQNPPPNTVITATANVSQQQVMPRLVITSPHASSNVWGA